MSVIFKIFLTVNSLLLSFLVFAVKENLVLKEIVIQKFNIQYPLPDYASYLSYIALILLLTGMSIKMASRLDTDQIQNGSIESIEAANDMFLPSYLGYFFVALSVPSVELFLLVFGIISIFIFYSRISYFNPIFFLFGFNFYYITNSNKVKVLLITKKQLKKPADAEFTKLKRINNYTFIDMEDSKK